MKKPAPTFRVYRETRQREESAKAREDGIMKVHKKDGMDAAAEHAKKTTPK